MSKDDIYYRLKHPVRKRIMEILGDEGRVSFTQLKNEVNVGVGKLYYHIDILGALITQDEYRRYMLTGEGRRALELLKMGNGGVIYPELPSEVKSIITIFTIKPVFQNLKKTPMISLPLLFIVVIFGAFLNIQSNLDPLFLFLLDKPEIVPVLIVLKSIIGPLTIFCFCDLISTFLYRRIGNHIALLSGIVFSQIPLIVFSLLWMLFKEAFLLSPWIVHFIFFIFQAWSIVLLIAALTYSKGLKFSQASLVVLAFTYFNIVLLNVPFLGG